MPECVGPRNELPSSQAAKRRPRKRQRTPRRSRCLLEVSGRPRPSGSGPSAPVITSEAVEAGAADGGAGDGGDDRRHRRHRPSRGDANAASCASSASSADGAKQPRH